MITRVMMISLKILVIAAIGILVFLVLAFKTSGDSLAAKETVKPILVQIVRKVEEVVYREATAHNPEGDLVPDQIDEAVKEKIKEKADDVGLWRVAFFNENNQNNTGLDRCCFNFVCAR